MNNVRAIFCKVNETPGKMEKPPILNGEELKGGYYKEQHLRRIIYLAKTEIAEEIWDDVVCPMCYRLNPHHAHENKGEGCNWCSEKEHYTGQTMEQSLASLKSKWGQK